MSDFKVVLPTTTEEWQRDMKLAYNNAIDDFVNACKENVLCQTFGLREIDIDEIAEQLKAGGENENSN